MSDRLLELLSQNAGMGDEVAALQAQLLRAKGLRTQAQTDPRRTTGKGGMFSALARGVNAYRAGTMEADNDTAQAGIDARRAEIMQNLPAIGGPGGAEVAFAQDPQAAALAAQQRADQNDQLGSALARTGDPRLTAAGAPYTADAKEQTGNVLKAAISRMGDRTKRDLSAYFDATPIPGAPGKYLWENKHTGETMVGGAIIMGPDGKPINAGGGSQRPQFQTMYLDGVGMVVHKWGQMPNGGEGWIPTYQQPPSAPPSNLPGATGAGAPPAAPGAPPAPGSGGPPAPTLATKPKVLPAGEANTMALENDQFRNINMLAASFKDDFAGKGIWGNAPVAWAQFVGSSDWLPKDNPPLAEWWANYRNMVENIQRKNTSGVAVTPLEAKLFAMAQNIRPGVGADVVRRAFQRLINEEGARLKGRTEARKAEGYAPAAVDSLTPADAAPASPQAPAGAPKYVRNPATGKLERVP